jgi:hypothetical protein
MAEQNRPTVVSLSNIANGHAVQIFDHNMRKVLENIKDPNTSAKAVRSITLKVDFMPYPDRNGSEVKISVSSRMAPVSSVNSTVFLGAGENGLQAYSNDTRQQALPLSTEEEKKPESNVVTIAG